MNDTAITIPCHLRTVRGQDVPVVRVHNDQVVANSEDVARFFGKRHDHVLRDIRNLIAGEKSCAPNFGWTCRKVEMPSGGTRDVPTCDMNRDGFTLLAMGFTGKRALRWKLRYIEAFNAMEVELNKPQMVMDDTKPPAKHKAEPVDPVAPIDQIDRGMSLLLTAEAAIANEDYRDKDTLFAIRCTIEQALKFLTPVREHINSAA